MLTCRPRILALAGMALLALAACSDLLQDEAPEPQRVLVQLKQEEFGRAFRAGYPVRLELFVSDQGGLGVEGVEVRWNVDPEQGTVQPDRERTNGNGFVDATWTPGTTAGTQRVRAELAASGASDTLLVEVLPDTVVGTVALRAETDTLAEGQSQTLSLARVEDRYGNAYDLASTGNDGPPPTTFATLDPGVLEVAVAGRAALVTGLAPGTGRVVATVGGRADTVEVVVKRFVPPGSFRRVSAGAYYSCASTLTGAARCWGENGAGQLGTGSAGAPAATPTALPALAGEDVTSFGTGDFHACAVAAGDVWCWGENFAGQLGDGTFDARQTPGRVQRPAGVSFVAVGAGIVHTCALGADGSAWCWGDNSAGQLGNGAGPGDPGPEPVRVAVPAGITFSQLSVGGVHTCALTPAGEAWCWGDNSTGQLGAGTFDAAAAPVAVQAPGPLRQVGAGVLHACAVSTAGQVLCWGDNSAGQLGNGTTDPSAAPVAVSGALAAVEVSGGLQHTCAVTPATDGRIFCWGANASGRLGTDGEQDSPIPVEVQSGTLRFQAVDVGNEHSCALGTDSEAYCWGRNSAGEVGNGSASQAVLKPVRVASQAAGARTAVSPSRPRAAVSRGTRRPATCGQLPVRIRTKLRICR